MGRTQGRDQALISTAFDRLSTLRLRRDHETLWHLLLIAAFAIGSARSLLFIVIEPGILGSHSLVYTDAARAWLTGGDPWQVGPPSVVFAGPPPMLLPFAVLTPLPVEAIRWISVIGTAALAWWTVRRLGLPVYWLLFPPIFASVLLGHPEILVLAILVAGGALSGLAAVIKPYAGLPLLAEQRWRAIGVAAAIVLLSAPFLPWPRFIAQLPEISATLARQAQGDSVFGSPLLMAVAVIALARLGLRRALWLATPVLWPSAQPLYKVASVPALSPIIAAAWALPIPGLTLAGVLLEALALEINRRRPLPRFLQLGIAEADRPWTPTQRGVTTGASATLAASR